MSLGSRRYDTVEPGFFRQCGKKKFGMRATLQAGGWGFQMDVQGLAGHKSHKETCPNRLGKVQREQR